MSNSDLLLLAGNLGPDYFDRVWPKPLKCNTTGILLRQ